MAYPSDFYFWTDSYQYNQGETVYVDGWAQDYDGYYDLYKVDWWLYNQDTGYWTDLYDSYFDDYSSYSYWNDIETTISGLGAGNYEVWGQAIDDQYNYSNWYSYDFSVYGGYNYAPSDFYFWTDKYQYNFGETINVDGWAQDYDGYDDLYKVDWWLYNQDTGYWTDLSDTYFDDYSSYSDWNDIQTTLSSLNAGNYQVWGQAMDDSGDVSDWYSYDFSVAGGGGGHNVDLTGYNFDVVYEPAYAGDYITVDFEIHNNGSAYADGFYVDFYLSDDEYISEYDEYLGSYYVSGVYGNSSTGWLTETLTLPSTYDSFWSGSGDYYVGMDIDYYNDVAETNEYNNSNVGFTYDYDDVYIYA